MQHACLRWLLERQQAIPRNYGEFLVFVADDLQLLKRSGGQFRFYHDLLRERIVHNFPRQSIISLPPQPAWQQLSVYTGAFCLLLAFVFGAKSYTIIGVPANHFRLNVQDILWHNELFYKNQTKSRGDVIRRKRNKGEEKQSVIAQIIGLPGETITVKKGKLLVNDIAYGDRYSALKFAKDLQTKRLPGDRYLAIRQIGDRIEYILLAPEDIQAKMLFRIYPFDRFGPIEP